MHNRPSLQNHRTIHTQRKTPLQKVQGSLRKNSSFAAALVVVGSAILAPLAYAVDYSNPHARQGSRYVSHQGHGGHYGGHSRYSRDYRYRRDYRGHSRYSRNQRGYSRYGRYQRAQPRYGRYQRAQPRYGQHMWFKAHVQGTPRIVIDLSDQIAYFYKGGRLAGMSPVSTGKPGHRTPTGNFRISEKKYSHRSNLYGHYISARGQVLRSNVDVRRHRKPAGSRFRGASMDYMMRINGPVTMHAGYVPGYPASHGCIRIPWHMAKIFYRHARVGTKVSVVP